MIRSSTERHVLGVTSLGHDASVALIEGDVVLFAAHAERYSRVKNDGLINKSLLDDALNGDKPHRIVWYEKPHLKALRWAYSGQWEAFGRTPSVHSHLNEMGLGGVPVSFVGHHESHAAGGYFTSGFDEAAVIVCDAIGEFATTSVWVGQGDRLTRIWQANYPHSLGLLYSAFTQRVGLKPNEEEYILMGMAALGVPKYADDIRRDFIDERSYVKLKRNVHRGISWWRPELTDADFPDIAASIQEVIEERLVLLADWVKARTRMSNLVFMGGVALNCVANTKIAEKEFLFDNIWIMPNPGDAGSSIGAVAAHLSRPIIFNTPYLGHEIKREFDHASAVDALLQGKVIGVANGRAEFGPRALGNRSLICDPRGPDVKDRVNAIKRREPFRPFAPIVMEHLARDYFELPVPTSPYMQFVGKVKRPDLFPAITHYDGTARVQTLNRDQNPVFYRLLELWHEKTGCPMLLNTSLNIKGMPLVNTWEDALEFSETYGVEVF